MVIRWLATEVRIFAYFKNLPLTAAFLGMGLGFVWAKHKYDFYKLSSICFLYLCLLLCFALVLNLTFLTFVDPLKFLLFGFAPRSHELHGLAQSLKTVAIMLGIFVLTSAAFIGPGQEMGKRFEKLEPLKAYSINILGGLIGTILFSLLSFWNASPGIWLISAGSLFFSIKRSVWSVLIIVLGLAYSFWLGPYIASCTYGNDYVCTRWSPYYRIDVSGYRPTDGPARGQPVGFTIYANYDGLQSVVDATPKSLARFPESFQKDCLAYQTELFQLVKKKPASQVLVLGSGAGMDVAAALRQGVAHVYAVEIDPVIAEIGRTIHPEKPYLSDRVTLYVTDARTYLRNCRKKYDAVVFAYLDSHAAFGCLSSLRMDNYVFTQEALNDAVKVLKPDGQIAIGCVLMTEWLYERHARALQQATNMVPIGERAAVASKTNTASLFAGPGIAQLSRENTNGLKPLQTTGSVTVATDDWPFLFLEKKEIPTLYVWPIILILSVSLLPVSSQFAGGARQASNWLMFFMGAGFMLLEVRSMAEMSLLFGSTWLTNSAIIGGVMLMILFANLLASRLSRTHIPWLALGLLLSIVFTLIIPPRLLSFSLPAVNIIAGSCCCLLPMFIAALLFALFFRDNKTPSQALAFNLIGGVLGVFCEYLSMWLGIGALGYLAIGIYALALSIDALRQQEKPMTAA